MKRAFHSVYHLFSFCILLLAACSTRLDNFDAPAAGIRGSIIDAATKEPIETEQPNGIKIRLLEEKFTTPVPIDFWAKADGTFENTKVFAGKYKVIPVEGAFFPPDTAAVTVNGITEVNFTVTPFLNITATAVAGAGSIIVQYRLSRRRLGDKITECKSLVSAYPAVSNIVNEQAVVHNVTDSSDNWILAKPFSDTVTGLKAGQIYYIRVAARTANANNKYNYSSTMEVKAR